MAEGRRKLAAILSADVAGYSRLMGEDEEATVAALNDCRAIFRDTIATRQGRVVDTAGDSVLAVFPSVVEAVRAAVEIQEALAQKNAPLSEDRRMHFRIGVNLGDVVAHDDGTIYGDGVNIAARIEEQTEPGGVCISESAYLQVRGKLDLVFDDLGERQLKNIVEPLRIFRLWTDGSASSSEPSPGQRSTSAAEGSGQVGRRGISIAVLPFKNMSGDPEQAYFADGLTEDIMTALSRFADLIVAPRHAVARHRNGADDITEIAQALGVRYVLEGSVRKSGQRVRVSAQLADVIENRRVWAERYDKDLVDIFELQDALTQTIAATLGITLQDAAAEVSKNKPTESLDAYDCLLRARDVLGGRMTPDDHAAAKTFAERAVSLDPAYGHGHAVLANIYLAEHRWSLNPAPRALERAYEAAIKAVKLTPRDAYARLWLAMVYFFRHELQRFEAEADRAVELNPNDPDIVATAGMNMMFVGANERGRALMERALHLNPIPPGWYYYPFVHEHYADGEYQTALDLLERIAASGSSTSWLFILRLASLGQLGRIDDAEHIRQRFREHYPGMTFGEEARKWNIMPQQTALLARGLRKAGLDIPDEPAACRKKAIVRCSWIRGSSPPRGGGEGQPSPPLDRAGRRVSNSMQMHGMARRM